MERIDLFDDYIFSRLSPDARRDFERSLENDTELASEFEVYLFTVRGICREARQDDMDFGIAVKKLSKERLREIVGNPSTVNAGNPLPDRTVASAAFENARIRQVRRRNPWIWPAVSVAAVAIVAFIAVLNVQRSARESVDLTIYEMADTEIYARSGDTEGIDLKSVDDDKLEAMIPELRQQYCSVVDNGPDSEIVELNPEYGFVLAMAYLRLHDRHQAKKVLEEMIREFDNNPDYSGDVHQWRAILDHLK